MAQIMLWKLGSDIALVLSLIYFAYRFFKSRGPAVNIEELQDLNNRLKAAVREADEAGRALSDQLLTRKQSLEKMLFELETVEHRLNKVVTSAEEQKSSLDIAIRRAVASAAQEKTFIVDIPQPIAVASQVSKVKEPHNRVEVILEEPAPPSFESSFGVEVTQKQNSNMAPPRNNPYVALSNVVEKEVQKKVEPSIAATMEEIYTIAENLLQTGRTLEEVAARTRLPVDEVRMISQLLEREHLISRSSENEEKDEEHLPASSEDRRLGVLAGIKRQTQVL